MGRVNADYDVVVVGGGAGGVSAAVGAAQAGARTLLVERYGFLGGAATISNVLTYCGFFTQESPAQQVVWGVGEQMLRRLHCMGIYCGRPFQVPSTGNRIILLDPEATKFCLDGLVLEAGVDVRLHTRVIGAATCHGRLGEIECADHGGRFTIRAGAFVDASGDANLSFLSGASTVLGNTAGEFQTGSMMVRFGGIPADVQICPSTVAEAVCRAKEAGISPLGKEKGMVLRVPLSNDVITILVDEAVDGLDSASLSRAEMHARQQAWAYLRALREFLPGAENAYIVSTGPQLGIRETRHAVGRLLLTGDDVLRGARHSDAVARGGWPVELHPAPGKVSYQSIANRSYYDIPYGAIASRDIDNLWAAGRAMSCDPVAYGSARVMGTAFGTGHAAGVAAATWLGRGEHCVESVRAELTRQGAAV